VHPIGTDQNFSYLCSFLSSHFVFLKWPIYIYLVPSFLIAVQIMRKSFGYDAHMFKKYLAYCLMYGFCFHCVQFCNAIGLEFLVFRLWISVWIAVFAILVVMFEGAFLVRYFTRFMQEIFIALISLIFIYETFKKIFVVSCNLSCFYNHMTLSCRVICYGPCSS